jgi:hypothetical protein
MKNDMIEILECLQWATTFAEGSRDLGFASGAEGSRTMKFNQWVDRCRAAITLASPSPKTALATIWVLKAYDSPTEYPHNPSAETYALREEDLPVRGFRNGGYQGYLCEVGEKIEVATDSDEYRAAQRRSGGEA